MMTGQGNVTREADSRDSVCFHRNPDSGKQDFVCRDSVCLGSVGKPMAHG